MKYIFKRLNDFFKHINVFNRFIKEIIDELPNYNLVEVCI